MPVLRNKLSSAIMLAAVAFAWLGTAPTSPLNEPKAPNDTSPTLITLHYTNAPATKILDDLFNQIGFSYAGFPDSPDTWPVATIDVDKVPFWEAAVKIEDAISLNYGLPRNGKINVIHVTQGLFDSDMGLRCISGSCLLTAREVRHVVNPTDPDHPDDCVIEVALLPEPHLQYIRYSTRLQPDVAIDENGVSLLREAPVSQFRFPQIDTYSQFEIPLQPTTASGHKIVQIKGSLQLGFMDEVQAVEIAAADFAKPVTINFQGAQIAIAAIVPTVTNLTPQANRPPEFRFSMNLLRGGLSEANWNRVNELIDAADISIRDDKNIPYYTSGGGGGRGDTNRLLSKVFRATEAFGTPNAAAGAPAKCVLLLPQKIKDVAIPYEFKNIPLP